MKVWGVKTFITYYILEISGWPLPKKKNKIQFSLLQWYFLESMAIKKIKYNFFKNEVNS